MLATFTEAIRDIYDVKAREGYTLMPEMPL